MTIKKSINLALVALIATIGSALLLAVTNVSAQESGTLEAVPVTTQAEESAEPTEEPAKEATSTNNFDYVAQPNDSYSLMARKAIQTYGINNNVNMSGAQIIFAETNLTKVAGSPVLSLGQQVTVDGNLVAEWVKNAQALTEQQQTLWQSYANNANFITNAVGQPAN